MKTSADLLEKALKVWEQFFFLMKLAHQNAGDAAWRHDAHRRGVRLNGLFTKYPAIGPAVHSEAFRKHLLRAVTDNFDEKFIGGDAFERLGSLRRFPHALFAWSKYSRRVFHLTPDLQVLLQNTSLEGVTWNEVGFPFESFAISSSVPIRDDKGRSYGMILYSPMADQPGREIHLLPTDLDGFNALNQQERRDLYELFRRKKYPVFERKFEAATKPVFNVIGWPCLRIYGGSDDSPVTGIRYFTSHEGKPGPLNEDQVVSLTDLAKNILVGMCLYFQTLPAKSRHRSEWQRPTDREATPDPQAISNEAEVCEVSCQYVLGPEELEAVKDAVASAHTGHELLWKRILGVWRRPPGYGHIPGYPRSVWQRPYWRRKDRAVDGHLPGGTLTIVE